MDQSRLNKIKLSKLDKKLRKKISTIKYKLQKNGIAISDYTTKILCVSNAGLDNGGSSDTLYKTFVNYGEIDDVIMFPGKTFAIVRYQSVASAVNACQSLNTAKVTINASAALQATIYLFYIDAVPQTEILKSCNPPEGLTVLYDFISSDYEKELLTFFDVELSQTSLNSGRLKHRQVQHYGYEFIYGSNTVNPKRPLSQKIPTMCDHVLNELIKLGHIVDFPDQLTVNKYLPGHGIPVHVDSVTDFTDAIVSVSLGSQTVMEFKHIDGRQTSIVLPQRSVTVMTGPSRYEWMHGITPRRFDVIYDNSGAALVRQRYTRLSLTFRKLSSNDSAQAHLPSNNKDAQNLENKYVHEVYKDIAEHYSETRHTPWPFVGKFVKEITQGKIFLDVGCGNGKYLGLNPHIYEVGVERSANLSMICRSRGHNVIVGDILSLPLRSDSVDVCICIAVIHHLSTSERRRKAIEELARVVKPGGEIFIQVWALEQEFDRMKSKYIDKKASTSDAIDIGRLSLSTDVVNSVDTPDCSLTPMADSSIIPVHINRTPFRKQDLLVPWRSKVTRKENKCNSPRNNVVYSRQLGDTSGVDPDLNFGQDINESGYNQDERLMTLDIDNNNEGIVMADSKAWTTFHRFYHVFQQGELEKLCNTVQGLSIQRVFYDNGNWCVLCHKCKHFT